MMFECGTRACESPLPCANVGMCLIIPAWCPHEFGISCKEHDCIRRPTCEQKRQERDDAEIMRQALHLMGV